ncbi:hypothetical protein JCM10908_002187 [Rhodotorula pacifica]|uniref:TFIIH/NER complex subunit TFB3 n=1 Tax=Rhodotorula pacifica TaxID=1495444 RepID=UPI00317AD5DD
MAAPKPRFFLGGTARRNAPTQQQRGSSTPSASRAAAAPPPPPADLPLINPQGDRRIQEYSSEQDQCPICKNDRYLNPKLRLMVSKCYHKMCESCLDRLFSLGPEPCPVCGQTIRKNQFQPQIFENLDVQKEIAIRRRTAKVFNKQPDDFATVEQYNDYLEEYESITFALINSIGNDLAETERKIRAYEAENRNSIDENEERLAREKERLEANERGEKEWRELEKKRYLEEEERKDRERAEERRRVLEQLEEGKLSPSTIMAASASRLRAAEEASSSSSGRPSGSTTTNAENSTPKLKFLANLARPSLAGRNGNGAGGGGSGEDLDPLDVADYAPGGILDPLSDYPHPTTSSSSSASPFPGMYDSHSPLYVPITSSAYSSSLGSLVAEREREKTDPLVKAGGFRADEVFEKAIREAVMGLWERPKGWVAAAATSTGTGEGTAMQVDVGA